jgi:lysyl-tRNA synthetase class 2
MIDWQPTASVETLKARANIIAKIRQFFAKKDVLEVETPLLSHATVTDPYIQSIAVPTHSKTFYLQTSPEYAMKRLLAFQSGSIYQICKSFRSGEVGQHHNPEFTMLEWYRTDFELHDLMDEMDELLQCLLNSPKAERLSYQEAFNRYLSINPHFADAITLQHCAKQHGIDQVIGTDTTDRDTWLQLLMSDCIEPQIGKERPTFIYNYPSSQSALSRIRNDEIPVAERFEVYFKGLELANGFHELADAKEQRARFEHDLVKRRKLGYSEVPIDYYFLAALEHGLPNCSGVALGIDRVMMIALNKSHLKDVVSFTFDRS